MCRNHHQTTNMSVKVSSPPSPKHHLNPFARPYNKTPPLYFVQPLLPLRYYYPHFQYLTCHKNANTNDQPKQMAKNMYVKRFNPNHRRILSPRQRPRQVWRPKLGDGVAENVHVDEQLVSAPLVFAHDDDDNQNTSVMMRNIPNQYRFELMKFLDKCCAEHKLEYDFFYLPIDFRRHYNKGYAFINFTKPPYAKMFQQLMTGYKWGFIRLGNKLVTSRKTCEITWAKLQGKEELVNHFISSRFPCYRKNYLPVELSPPSKGDASLSALITVGSYLGAA